MSGLFYLKFRLVCSERKKENTSQSQKANNTSNKRNQIKLHVNIAHLYVPAKVKPPTPFENTGLMLSSYNVIFFKYLYIRRTPRSQKFLGQLLNLIDPTL